MADDLRLSSAFSSYAHLMPLKDGTVKPSGISLDVVDVEPVIAAYRRMVRGLEFDVCELAPTTYLMAREAGLPIKALPAFVMRKFHHGDLVCRLDADIQEPKDLAGKRVGVRAYSVTTGVWVRSILAQDHGLDLDSVTWVVDDEDHVTSYRPPANVEMLEPGRSIVDEFGSGGIVAALTGPAGVGRSGSPVGGWQEADPTATDFRTLFPEPEAAAADWHQRTGIYPVHGLIVVREEILEANPWVAQSLMDAFTTARDEYVARLDDPSLDSVDDRRCRAVRPIVGPQPLPYGVADNRTSLEALIDTAHAQKLIRRRPDIADVFAEVSV